MDRLPDELVLLFVARLDVRSTAQLAQTCLRLHELCRDDHLWRHYLQRDHPDRYAEAEPWLYAPQPSAWQILAAASPSWLPHILLRTHRCLYQWLHEHPRREAGGWAQFFGELPTDNGWRSTLADHMEEVAQYYSHGGD